MLYVTTGDNKTTYTAQYVMEQTAAPDGRLFVPMRLPHYDEDSMEKLCQMPFWDCVAEILNQFFPLRLRGSELACQNLTEPELISLPYKIDLVQLWSRKKGSFGSYGEEILANMGCGTDQPESWPRVAVSIAVLFALYGTLRRRDILQPGDAMNLVFASGQLCLGAAVMYAGEMGLSVGQSVLVCNENGLLWELFHRGEARLDGEKINTKLPLLDVAIPTNLERLIFHRLGAEGLRSYLKSMEKRGMYILNPEEREVLRCGFSVAVVGSGRGDVLIPRIYKNSHCLLSPYTALVYGGLTDYRSMEAEGRPVVLLAEESPMQWGEAVLKAMRIPVQSVTTQIMQLERDAAGRQGAD